MMMLWWVMKKEAFFEDGRDRNSRHSRSSLCISSDKVKQANSSDHRHTFLQCSISHQG